MTTSYHRLLAGAIAVLAILTQSYNILSFEWAATVLLGYILVVLVGIWESVYDG